MKGSAHRMMVVLLIALMALTVWSRTLQSHESSAMTAVLWQAFLFGLPTALIGFLLAGARWALMAGVLYGTIGLALDISTAVLELGRADSRNILVTISGVSGLFNFLLILFGGAGFLDVTSAGSSGAPPGDLPPNPPFRSSV